MSNSLDPDQAQCSVGPIWEQTFCKNRLPEKKGLTKAFTLCMPGIFACFLIFNFKKKNPFRDTCTISVKRFGSDVLMVLIWDQSK